MRFCAALATILLAAPLLHADDAAADPSACPPAGFVRASCLVARAHGGAGCGPAALETRLDRTLDRAARLVNRAARTADRGRLRAARAALKRADRLVQGFRARGAKLADRGKLDGPCAGRIDAVLALIHDALAALGSGTAATTTTTVPVAPRGTTTTVAPASSTTATVATTTTTTTAVATCGNGRVDRGEQCDGNVFGGAVHGCEDLGFVGGTLGCRPDCIFDTTGCYI